MIAIANKLRSYASCDGLSELTDLLEVAARFVESHHHLLTALEPFTDIGPQKDAWGVISKTVDDMQPLTVTVTKAQMKKALLAVQSATVAKLVLP